MAGLWQSLLPPAPVSISLQVLAVISLSICSRFLPLDALPNILPSIRLYHVTEIVVLERVQAVWVFAVLLWFKILLFSSPICRTSTFVTFSTQLIFSIPAKLIFQSFPFSVSLSHCAISAPKRATFHTVHFTITFFKSVFSLLVRSRFGHKGLLPDSNSASFIFPLLEMYFPSTWSVWLIPPVDYKRRGKYENMLNGLKSVMLTW